MKAFIFIVTLFIAADAVAQENAVLCKLLKQNQSVVGAAYQPGVDAYGRAVVPADVNAAPTIPETITIPLEVDLAERLQLAQTEGLNLDAPLGTIEIRTDGQVILGEENVTAKALNWCGTPVPEPMIEVDEPIESEERVEGTDVILENEVKEEIEVIEVEAKTPILPQEVEEVSEESDTITGSDYRDYSNYNE